MDNFDSHYCVEMKELIIPGYNNNTLIKWKMVMFLMAINNLASTETRVLYGAYGTYRPVCYHAHILSVI